MDNSSLAKRMKQYESVSKSTLVRRMPVIIRLDGRSFHTFTKGFKRPFDDVLIETMQETMKHLCENIQGCVLGYTQSDEITLVLVDYKNLDSQSWFDNEVQKICSIAASMATMAFNKYLLLILCLIFRNYLLKLIKNKNIIGECVTYILKLMIKVQCLMQDVSIFQKKK